MAGLAVLGFQPLLNTARKNGTTSAHGLCGASLTRYEVSVGGKKAIAAAQWNLANASLQHGTIYLKAPVAMDQFWPEGSGHLSPIDRQGWWAFDDNTMNEERRWAALADALKDGLARTLGLSWHEDDSSWPTRPEVAARRRQWSAERWHEKR